MPNNMTQQTRISTIVIFSCLCKIREYQKCIITQAHSIQKYPILYSSAIFIREAIPSLHKRACQVKNMQMVSPF